MGTLSQQKIIETAAILFTQQGYKCTTMDDIARACQVKKPSLYHHIQSREMLALEVLDKTVSNLGDSYTSIIYNKEASLSERLVQLLTPNESLFIAISLIDTLWHEAGREVPEIRKLVRSYFAAWGAAIAFLLRSHYGKVHSKKLAEEAIAQLYGALGYKNIFQDCRPFISIAKQITGLLKEPKRNILFHSGGFHDDRASFG